VPALFGLIRWLHPDVDIRLSPYEFEFAASGRTRSFSPVLYLSPSGTRPRVLAAGDAVVPASKHVRVELLNPASLPPPPWTRESCLLFKKGRVPAREDMLLLVIQALMPIQP